MMMMIGKRTLIWTDASARDSVASIGVVAVLGEEVVAEVGEITEIAATHDIEFASILRAIAMVLNPIFAAN